MAARRTLDQLRTSALAAIALVVGMHYARMGYMPLDQSIGFDGGWRVACGQAPFVEYTAPNGFAVHAMQALFFRLFGVTWFVYCLHAAVVNAFAVLLVDRLLRLLGLERWASSVFALCTAFAFYPPFGVPYMDGHAFFFSLAALVFAVGGARAVDERARRWCWISVAPALALALLSKQIPSAFFAPAVAAIALWAPRERARALKWLAASGLGVAAVLVLAALVSGVRWELVDTYFRRLPTEEGARRVGYVPDLASLLRRFEETREQFGLWSVTLVHAVGLTGTLAALAGAATMARRRDWKWTRPIATAAAAEFLLVASLAFVALTGNDKENGVALVFASAGAAAAALTALGNALGERARWAARGLVFAFACVAVRDTAVLKRGVLDTRRASDLAFDEAAADAASADLPDGLRFLRWQTPKRVPYSAADLRDLVRYLRERPGGVWLVGDASIVYALARKEPPSPSLWFHPGLTLPYPYDSRFEGYESMLLERFADLDVRTVVIEGEHPWVGYPRDPGEKPPKPAWLTLDKFPRVQALVEARRSGERAFGAFRAIELAGD
jgi:hypothetical protein